MEVLFNALLKQTPTPFGTTSVLGLDADQVDSMLKTMEMRFEQRLADMKAASSAHVAGLEARIE